MATQASAALVPGAATSFSFNVPNGAAASSNQTPGSANYIGFNRVIAIQPAANMTLAFFNSTSTSPATANANSWPLLTNAIAEFDTGSSYDSISVFNTTGANATVYVWPLAKI